MVSLFEHAPVVERVVGVQFHPIPGLHNGLLGAYWKTLGNDWPTATDAAPIEQQFERFGEGLNWDPLAISISLSRKPPSRLQISSLSSDRKIQLQNGRFHLNWIGTAGPDYPRFPQLAAEFRDQFGRFRSFLSGEGIETLRVNQWEVTYVNSLPRGGVWNSPSDWSRLFRSDPTLAARIGDLELESFSGAWHYVIGNAVGRLHVEIRPTRDQTSLNRSAWSSTEALLLILTARGPIFNETADDEELGTYLTTGRKAISDAFRGITSEAAHASWGLQDESD